MKAPIDFYFDFSSPYGYVASEKIEALAAKHGRSVAWHPMLLGVVFKQTGAMPLTQVPLKGDYSRRDMARTARFHGVGFRLPSNFPIATQAPARVVLWARERDAALAPKIIHALYRAFFVDDVDISNADAAATVAASCGADAASARAAVDDPSVKEALKRENEQAMGRGVFGSPFMIVDDEPFWGVDHLDQVDRWLATGGW
ncbi:MAG TPA: 2-hydroxychromene-2-carboxylate isomerase [Casimicrobiaceae bacterium]|jgi:2-hydroxychromene-2-carboxylate isomerase|nr:2-hydroxychromene-2-carboxylate isomerase [Casimicrobiaceae bacterium]